MNKIITGLLILLFVGCAQVNVLHHDEDMAANSAKHFANIVLIDKKFQIAYGLMSNNAQNYFNFDKFKSMIQEIHPNGYPAEVIATDYEPIPGQAGMNILLEGKNQKEIFYYRLLMEGTKDKGYKVSGIWRGNGKNPGSKLTKKLKSS